MFETIDEITMSWEEDGVEKVKELDKRILTRGGWTTILFKYQEWSNKKEEYGPIKFSIRRYRKRNDQFREQSRFNISNAEQAKKIIAALQSWIDESG
ncbi:MAG: hypothetical protein B6244_07215 [Candidatus Cloacimonetes bacterium 4572_55]|nr:MAG: hypothetical protein B6244_07215 [Candidatus Cloacimonetes bacterium 4572_55]